MLSGIRVSGKSSRAVGKPLDSSRGEIAARGGSSTGQRMGSGGESGKRRAWISGEWREQELVLHTCAGKADMGLGCGSVPAPTWRGSAARHGGRCLKPQSLGGGGRRTGVQGQPYLHS